MILFQGWQLDAFVIANFATALAYFIIALKPLLQRGDEARLDTISQILLQAFVGLCGNGHFWMGLGAALIPGWMERAIGEGKCAEIAALILDYYPNAALFIQVLLWSHVLTAIISLVAAALVEVKVRRYGF